MHLLGLPVPEKTQLVRMMQGLGQLPFNPPNVKGWAGGESWITTYTLLLRQQFLRRMVEATTVSSMDGNMAMSMRPDRRAERKEQAPADEVMQQPMEARGRSRAAACAMPACEARLGPTLAGIDAAGLRAHAAAAPADRRRRCRPAPGAVVAAAMLDPVYQLK